MKKAEKQTGLHLPMKQPFERVHFNLKVTPNCHSHNLMKTTGYKFVKPNS